MTIPQPAEKATWKVISPPPHLSLARANDLLVAWRGAQTVVEAEPLAGGIMNWNYCIRLSDSVERFVLRFYDRNPASCAKEVRVLELVRDEVPVPRVLVSGEGTGDHPPFCVLEFIDGISLRELRRRGNAQGVAEATRDAGRLLPRLTRHRFAESGSLSPSLEVEPGPFAGASLSEVVEHFAGDPLFCERIDAPLRHRIFELSRATEALHAVEEPASLVHGDFNSPNILVHEREGHWAVAAILDWEFALSASMFVDIGNMLRYERPGQSRYEPYFSEGLVEGGWRRADEWFLRARLADLPALCELLTRSDVPDAIVAELRALLMETISGPPR